MVVSSECGRHSKEVTEVGEEGEKGRVKGDEVRERVGRLCRPLWDSESQ